VTSKATDHTVRSIPARREAPAESTNHRASGFAIGADRTGFPVDVVGTTELHATFREESRTSLFSASAALQEIREATGLFVVFSQGKPHRAAFIAPQ
jgi:hypothetical protein